MWAWRGAGSLLVSHKARVLTRLPLPAHMAVIREQRNQPFDLTVWLKRRTFKVVFEMHCCRNTWAPTVRLTSHPTCMSYFDFLIIFFSSVLLWKHLLYCWHLGLQFKTVFLEQYYINGIPIVASSSLQQGRKMQEKSTRRHFNETIPSGVKIQQPDTFYTAPWVSCFPRCNTNIRSL